MIKIGPNGSVPNSQYVLCTANLEQKKTYHIPGTEIDLLIENKYNDNYRERNPNYAEVVYIPNSNKFQGYEKYRHYDQILKPGDKVCVQHFQLIDDRNESKAIAEDFDGKPLFLVDLREVYFKIVKNKPVPLSNYTLCEYADPLKDKTSSGLFIPEIAQEQERRNSKQVIVKYVSEFVKKQGVNSVSPGDRVLFIDYADYELEFDGKKYLKIASDEILGILEDDALNKI